MKTDFIRSADLVTRAFWSVVITSLVGVSVAQAYPWSREPQPLLHNKAPILADAGSPLAWDQSAEILWFIESGKLHSAWWAGPTFNTGDTNLISPLMEGGLVIDSDWHFLYCLDANGLPQCVRRVGSKWVIRKIGNEPLTRLLGVDAGQHWLFGYDAAANGIRRYNYNAQTGAWSSAIIATGLGAVGDTAAVDSAWHTIYSTHETVGTGVPRHPGAQVISDPTGIGKFKPWSLVATAWNGKTWTSRVLDETGVPQQPAVRASDHRVFYAQRDEPDLLHYYQPKFAKLAESFGRNTGWSGQDTYEDNDSYPILNPQFPNKWISLVVTSNWSVTGSVISIGNYWNWPFHYSIQLKGPITIIPYYEPIWTDVATPPRLASFRALVNPLQGRLVQHRECFSGEVVRQQTGAELAGYLFRDANGVLVTKGCSTNSGYSSYAYGGTLSSGVTISSGVTLSDPSFLNTPGPTPAPTVYYPQLGVVFDPTSPPASFAALSDADVPFYAEAEDIVADPTLANSPTSQAIPPYCSTDPNAPFVPAQLRLPTQVDLLTFGHRYLSPALNQVGARYRSYSNYGTNYAVPSAIAVDNSTGVTFYTQAPPPSEDEASTPSTPQDAYAPLPTFRPLPDPKLPRPSDARVWIVMVY